MASAFGSSTTGSNAASFQPCNASRMRLTPSRSTPSWISAFENGPSIQPIFVYHPQGKLHEVQYARRVTRPLHSAGGDAGAAGRLGPDILRGELRLPTEALGASGGGAGAGVYRVRIRRRGGS